MVPFVVVVVCSNDGDHDNDDDDEDDDDDDDDDDFGGGANEFPYAWLILIEDTNVRNSFRFLTKKWKHPLRKK